MPIAAIQTLNLTLKQKFQRGFLFLIAITSHYHGVRFHSGVVVSFEFLDFNANKAAFD